MPKGVAPHGARLFRGTLALAGMACDGAMMLAGRGPDGAVAMLPFSAPNRERKHFGPKKGARYSIGRCEGNAPILIAEGFATSATLHETTGYPVAVAFDAGNLPPVARALRDKYATPGSPFAPMMTSNGQSGHGRGARCHACRRRSHRGARAVAVAAS